MCSLLLFIITVANAPTINYEVINATAIRIYWSITGNANGFIINITSNGLPIVTQQLTDGSVRELYIMEYHQKGITLLKLECTLIYWDQLI